MSQDDSTTSRGEPRNDGGTVVDTSVADAGSGSTAGIVDAGGTVTDIASEATPGFHERVALAGKQVGALAASEVRLAWRRRWIPILVGLFAVFGLLVLTFAGSAPGPAGFERILASLATLCVYVAPLAALAYGYDAVVGPAESGWLDVVSALPVTRVRVLLGAALGRGVVLAGGVALGFALPGAVLVSEYGLTGWPPLATVLVAATGLGLAFMSVAVALSTLVREKTHALGGALLAWVWFVIVHDLLALGVVAAFELPDVAVTVFVLANPASVYRVLVLDLLGAGGGAGFGSVLSATPLSPTALALTLAAWVFVPLLAAAGLVRWRGTVTPL